MKSTIFLIFCLIAVSSARVLQLRHKRQLEVEGDNVNPSNDVVVIKDVNTNDNGPTYQLIPVDPNTGILFGAGASDAGANPNTDVVDLDINEDDGTFRLGGRLPSFHDHFHQTNFADMFRAIQQRFDGKSPRPGPLASGPDFTTRHMSTILIALHELRTSTRSGVEKSGRRQQSANSNHKLVPTIYSFVRRNGP